MDVLIPKGLQDKKSILKNTLSIKLKKKMNSASIKKCHRAYCNSFLSSKEL